MRAILWQRQRDDLYVSVCGPTHKRPKGPGSIVVSTLDDEHSFQVTSAELRKLADQMDDPTKLYRAPSSSVSER